MTPMIPWMGGKRRLVKHILPKFPEHKCYVEAFAGGAALLFAKEPSKVEVINDLNGDLVNLYRVIQRHLEEFVRQFKWAITSRKVYEWQKITKPETLTDIQRAARFYYLLKNGFGSKLVSPSFGTATTSPPSLNLLRLEEDLSAVHMRISRVFIENLPWQDCVKRYDRKHTLFYMDPPYWQVSGYGNEFGRAEYVEMAQLARSVKGAMIISINDHPDIREIFEGLAMESVGISYTVGGNKKPSKSKELIVCNGGIHVP